MKYLPEGRPIGGVTVAPGGAKTISAWNTGRLSLTFQNTSDTEMRVAETRPDASATHGYIVAPGQIVEASTCQPVTVWCSVAGMRPRASLPYQHASAPHFDRRHAHHPVGSPKPRRPC